MKATPKAKSPKLKSPNVKSPAANTAPTPTTTHAFIDGLDRAVARLLVGEQAFTVPRALLPRAAREGQWVAIGVGLVDPPPDDTDARRRRLARGDDGGDIEL